MLALTRVKESTTETEPSVRFESALRCTEAKLENGVLRNVPVNGGVSANGLDYTPALKKAAESKVYENAVVYLNHKEKDSQRDVQEKFGWLENVRHVEGKGLYGDLHYNPKHSYAEAFEWWAKNRPSAIGLSHDALIVKGKDGRVVEEIAQVLSVDVVHKPATVSGIQEGVIDDKIKSRRMRDVVEAAQTLIWQVIYPMDGISKNEAEQIDSIDEIVKDFRKELKSLRGGKTTESMEENDMDYTKLTLDELRKNRADLVTAAVKEHVEKEKLIADKCKAMLSEVHESLRTADLVDRVTEAVRNGQETIVKSLIDALKTVKITESKKSETPTSTGPVIPVKESQKESKPVTDDELLALINSRN